MKKEISIKDSIAIVSGANRGIGKASIRNYTKRS